MTTHRIILRDIASPAQPLYGIYSVAEDDSGDITSWSDSPFPLTGESIGDLILLLQELQGLMHHAAPGILSERGLARDGIPMSRHHGQ